MADGVIGGSDAASKQGSWITYKLTNAIKQEGDYVICEIKNTISNYLDKWIVRKDAYHFNEEIDYLVGNWSVNCPFRNCTW